MGFNGAAAEVPRSAANHRSGIRVDPCFNGAAAEVPRSDGKATP